MHQAAYEFVLEIASRHGHCDHVLEIGSRNINGTARNAFSAKEYVGIDRVAGTGVDIVIDAADYNGQEHYDVVVCTEVLEHAPDPQAVIDCAYRALKPGGRLILTAANEYRTPHGCNGGPVGNEHYQAVSYEQMHELLANWQDQKIEHWQFGDIYATAIKGR